MKLRMKLPPERTFEQVKNHFEVERAIADSLKRASKEERKKIYKTMYDELFAKVPDHPRLQARQNPEEQLKNNRRTFVLVEKYVSKETIFAEFAPGDCSFSCFMGEYVKQVIAFDISKQSGALLRKPKNFNLCIYDGYTPSVADKSIDVIFSDQLIEHLHPEDMVHHFGIVKKMLKPGGLYLFRTPHAFFGPTDVSAYFSKKVEGFHLKEWTFSELAAILKQQRFSHSYGLWRKGKRCFKVPLVYFSIVEKVLTLFPRPMRKVIARYFIPMKLVMIAIA